jgi:hypothetical protein
MRRTVDQRVHITTTFFVNIPNLPSREVLSVVVIIIIIIIIMQGRPTCFLM